MYLHVGNNQNIRERNIIGIFDADTATVSAITKKYLSAADARRAVEFASEEIPKSFVLYKEQIIWISESVRDMMSTAWWKIGI